MIDRVRGTVLGVAAGDALGAGGAGEWTDDTAQTAALLRVVVTGADLRTPAALDAVASGFAEWYAGDPSDAGRQTHAILGALSPHPTAAEMTAAARAYLERTGRAGGNGSLMRTAPVALAHRGDPTVIVAAAVAVSELTHADPRAGEACALWSLAIDHALTHASMPDLRDLLVHLPGAARDFWRERVDEAERFDSSRLRPNGYVVTALQAAWSAVCRTPADSSDPLARGIEAAIAIGDDTDTIAAIAGALLGARWGASAVPTAWRRSLHGWPDLTGDELADLAERSLRAGRPA
ncbi:ADP-ribosylglycohydrolase family protein [Nocardioides mangrovicus]|uniref:ADP-ribosylglycohydrolase family protein n=1 Tax=Nocardioides mangrovicus TaxID=2478913 RepID=A0A3L8P8Y4_9ACTN|nr:ADP-ribosylglycohydrolase family protein [Nocardioides mangrovicus]